MQQTCPPFLPSRKAPVASCPALFPCAEARVPPQNSQLLLLRIFLGAASIHAELYFHPCEGSSSPRLNFISSSTFFAAQTWLRCAISSEPSISSIMAEMNSIGTQGSSQLPCADARAESLMASTSPTSSSAACTRWRFASRRSRAARAARTCLFLLRSAAALLLLTLHCSS